MSKMGQEFEKNLDKYKYDLYEALKDILPELKEYVQEVGDCDHSVGICFCRLFNKVDNLEQALAKAKGK